MSSNTERDGVDPADATREADRADAWADAALKVVCGAVAAVVIGAFAARVLGLI